MGVRFDITEAPSVREAITGREARLGALDVLVNSVAHVEQPAEEVTLEAWDTVLDVNLRGAFLLFPSGSTVYDRVPQG